MAAAKLPNRLHHNAYVSKDLEATRKFYEDVIGLPLLATWCEKDVLFGAERTYCHCFFGLGDGGALAFFQFADPKDAGGVRPEDAVLALPPHRAARGQGGAGRHREASQGRPATRSRSPSCSSTAIAARSTRPTRTALIVEFTLDHPSVEKINADRRKDAHAELKRWLAGDHHSNNTYR